MRHFNVRMFYSRDDCCQIERVSVTDGTGAAVREAVSALVAPRVCTAILKDGHRCTDAETLCVQGQQPLLVAFVREANNAHCSIQHVAPDAGVPQKGSSPDETSQGARTQQKRSKQHSETIDKSKQSCQKLSRKWAKRKAESLQVCLGAVEMECDGEVDLLLAAAIAAQQKQESSGRKRGARVLEDAERVLHQGTPTTGGERAQEELASEHVPILEVFRFLVQLLEVRGGNHLEILTLGRLCTLGAAAAGSADLCRRRIRQLVFLCPHLFHIRPGTDPTDESQVTIQLLPAHTQSVTSPPSLPGVPPSDQRPATDCSLPAYANAPPSATSARVRHPRQLAQRMNAQVRAPPPLSPPSFFSLSLSLCLSFLPPSLSQSFVSLSLSLSLALSLSRSLSLVSLHFSLSLFLYLLILLYFSTYGNFSSYCYVSSRCWRRALANTHCAKLSPPLLGRRVRRGRDLCKKCRRQRL